MNIDYEFFEAFLSLLNWISAEEVPDDLELAENLHSILCKHPFP